MRGRAFVIILLFFLAIIPFAIAFDNLYDEWVYTLDTFEVEGDLFYVQSIMDVGIQSILLKKNDVETYIIRNGTCEETDYYQYCFLGTKLDYMDYGRQIPNSFRWEPAIHVKFYTKKPSVSVSRTASTEINKEDKVIVRVTIKNEEELSINNLHFEEILPDNAKLIFMDDGVSISGRTLSWTKSLLLKNSETSFVYTLIPGSYESIVIHNGTLEYGYSDSEYSVKASSTTIQVNAPFTFTSTMSKKEVDVGETFQYTFNVKNDDWEDELKGYLNLYIPSEIEIVSLPPWMKKSNNITETFDLNLNEEFSVIMTFRSSYKGKFKILTKSYKHIRDEIYEDENVFNVTVKLPTLEPTIQILKTEVVEGSPFTITANVNNPTNTVYVNLKGYVESSMFDTKTIDEKVFNPDNNRKVFDQIITAIPVTKPTDFDVVFRGQYQDTNARFYNFEERDTIKIIPFTQNFTIHRTISKTELYPGEEATVKLSATNIGKKLLAIRMEEEIPSELAFTTGITEKILNVDVGQTKDFYTYKFIIPEETSAGTYTLKTTAFANDYIEKIDEAVITVKHNETVVVIPDENPDVDLDDQQVESKKKGGLSGFFKRLLEMIFK